MIVHLLVVGEEGSEDKYEWRELNIRPSSIINWYLPDADATLGSCVIVDTVTGVFTLRLEEPLQSVLMDIRKDMKFKEVYYECN